MRGTIQGTPCRLLDECTASEELNKSMIASKPDVSLSLFSYT